MPRNLSIWLLPSTKSPEYLAFSEVVHYLAGKHGKHPFPPHATLSMLPADFSLEIVRDVIKEVKEEWFTRRVEFGGLKDTGVAIMIRARRDTLGGLCGEPITTLQQSFHGRLQEEVEKRRKVGLIPQNTPDVKNIVPHFPHMSLAYTERGKAKSIADMEVKGWYKRDNEEAGVKMEIRGFKGYKIGTIYLVYCGGGGRKPEKWEIFERIEVE